MSLTSFAFLCDTWEEILRNPEQIVVNQRAVPGFLFFFTTLTQQLIM